MALSEQEQRLLAEMEQALAAEDPKLVNSFRGGTPRQLHTKRAALAGLAFLVGVGLLIGGMLTWPALSILGFLAMVGGAIAGLYAWQPVDAKPRPTKGGDTARPRQPQGSGPDNQNFMDKMEERWRRRRDEGL
ncbi:DUF3040 domain-containing protein [Propionibacteriaceae bacterium Y1685]|uniref:DUF3040 domain-containing protein n=1 Tax=Microlunatus sp. Y1700 TaxID=3418487 RepID=UPI003B78CCF4